MLLKTKQIRNSQWVPAKTPMLISLQDMEHTTGWHPR